MALPEPIIIVKKIRAENWMKRQRAIVTMIYIQGSGKLGVS